MTWSLTIILVQLYQTAVGFLRPNWHKLGGGRRWNRLISLSLPRPSDHLAISFQFHLGRWRKQSSSYLLSCAHRTWPSAMHPRKYGSSLGFIFSSFEKLNKVTRQSHGLVVLLDKRLHVYYPYITTLKQTCEEKCILIIQILKRPILGLITQ